MRKFLLASLVIILVALGVYTLALHSPTLNIFHLHYEVTTGTTFGNAMQQAKLEQVLVHVSTDGTVSVHGNGDLLGSVSYDPSNLRNAVTIANRYILPTRIRQITESPLLRPLLWWMGINVRFSQWFFYRVVHIGGTITVAIR